MSRLCWMRERLLILLMEETVCVDEVDYSK